LNHDCLQRRCAWIERHFEMQRKNEKIENNEETFRLHLREDSPLRMIHQHNYEQSKSWISMCASQELVLLHGVHL